MEDVDPIQGPYMLFCMASQFFALQLPEKQFLNNLKIAISVLSGKINRLILNSQKNTLDKCKRQNHMAECSVLG